MESGNKKRGRPPKTKDYNSLFAKRLRELCEGRTQQEIADGAGITRQNLGKFLLGETKPDVDTLEKLANFFNVSTDYLLGRTDARRINPSLEAAHEYTGLSIKAVKTLNEIDNFLLHYLKPEEIKNRHHIGEMLSLISEAIENEFFFKFASDTICLYHKSNEWTIKAIEAILNYGEHMDMYDQDVYKLYEECDLLRFRIIQDVSKYIEDKDCRYCVEYHTVTIESTLDMLKKQIYEYYENEDLNNGKHNPPERIKTAL